MDLRPEGVRDFFAYARERHSVYLRRASGQPPPWTDDPVIAGHRFTNVYRELDRTTIWCRQHVRERYDGTPEVLPAVVLFRWFNRIETGEAMFSKAPGLLSNCSPFDHWVKGGPDAVNVLRTAILKHIGPSGPYTNPAYIVKSPNGMDKLTGVLWCVEKFRTAVIDGKTWALAAREMAEGKWNLERSWNWLREHDHQGDFTAYEVISDLRHTHLLRGANDINTWANAGPGAIRGLNRVQGRDVRQSLRKADSLAEMQALLEESRKIHNWPVRDPRWPRWEMREVEHTLCEADKHQRVTLGQGRAKQVYHARPE